MTSRLGLSCSVDCDSSFSSTDITVPGQIRGGRSSGGGMERREKQNKGHFFKPLKFSFTSADKEMIKTQLSGNHMNESKCPTMHCNLPPL